VSRRAPAWLLLAAPLSLLAGAARGQISPGPLSRRHAALEGAGQCLKCHEPGKGVAAGRCLACHTLLRERVAAGKGLHARREYGDCKKCHVDHQGAEFELVFWGKPGRAAFDHGQTGHALLGKHAGVSCEACHQPRFNQRKDALSAGAANAAGTFLGLAPACQSCHGDPHRGTSFGGRECTRCHGQVAWRPATQFDHTLSGFALTGRHAAVACEACHDASKPRAAGRLAGLVRGRACASCHEDVHRARLGTDCARCHSTGGWRTGQRAAGFDHDRTAYPLRGRHAAVACAACHAPGRPLRLTHEACTDCHADVHRGQLASRADRGRCDACHDVNGFKPVRFAIEEHQRSRFALAGAHLAVPCDACHRPAALPAAARGAGARVPGAGAGRERTVQLRFAGTRCRDCHGDPHFGDVERHLQKAGCEACHAVESWKRVRFDHTSTRFALTGGHAKPACSACHVRIEPRTPRERVKLAGLPLACEACHRDPHQGQFQQPPIACDACHTTTDVRASKFDHARTSFPLDGAHARVACLACHRAEKRGEVAFVRYKPVPKACKDCHATSRAAGGAS
jgi:hypothetical protein